MKEDILTNLLIEKLKEGEFKKLFKSRISKVRFDKEIGANAIRTDIFLTFSSCDPLLGSFNSRKTKYVAIEVKIKDWEQGLYQAWRYNTFAERSYLALYSEFAKNIKIELFKQYNVGLIVFDEDKIEILNKPVNNLFPTMHSRDLRKKVWDKLGRVKSL